MRLVRTLFFEMGMPLLASSFWGKEFHDLIVSVMHKVLKILGQWH
jgi:hypothetical protein